MQAPQWMRSPAIRHGLMFGFILAVIYVVSAVIQLVTGVTLALALGSTHVSPLSLLNTVMWIVECALFFVAGWMTIRSFNGVPLQLSAAKAGLIAGLAVGVVEFVTTLIIDAVFIGPLDGSLPVLADFPLAPRTPAVYGEVIYLVMHIIVGAIFGTVGGVFGTRNLWRDESTKPKRV